MGEAGPLALCVPQVAVKLVIGEPPLLAGAVKLTVALPLAKTVETAVGAPGTVAGVTLFEAAEAGLAPALLVAVTVQVTDVPLVKPLTTMGELAPAAFCVPQVAAKLVIGEPLAAPAVKATETLPLPRVAVPIVGAAGTPAGVTLPEGEDAALGPTALVAITVQVTGVPLVSPLTRIGDVGPLADCEPQVAVKLVMGEPLSAPAVKATEAPLLAVVAIPMVGAPGTVAGVTLLESDEATLVPTPFVAVTVQVTGVPLVSPLTTMGELIPPALCVPQVTVNPVIGEPLSAPAVNTTVTLLLPRVAALMVGAAGAAAGVALFEAAEAALVPTALVAVTVQVTGVPLVRPLTTMGEEVPPPLCVPQVAVKPVIPDPLSAPAVKAIEILPLPRVAVPIVGAEGTPAGVTLFEADEAALEPTALVAVTVQVTGLPLVRPFTTMGEFDPLALCAPQVAVKLVIAEPLLAPAVKATETLPSPRVAVPIVGGAGTPAGVTLFDAIDATPVPIAFVAVTVKV
jgi:hypothetical protein